MAVISKTQSFQTKANFKKNHDDHGRPESPDIYSTSNRLSSNNAYLHHSAILVSYCRTQALTNFENRKNLNTSIGFNYILLK